MKANFKVDFVKIHTCEICNNTQDPNKKKKKKREVFRNPNPT